MARPPITAEQEAEIHKLRSQGLSERAIATKTGLSKTVAHNRVSATPGLVPAGLPAADPRPGFAGWLDRKDAAREARVGLAPGQPAWSVLSPEEWLVERARKAKVKGRPESREAQRRGR